MAPLSGYRKGQAMYKRILIATDGSDLAGKGVDHGLALAAALQAKVDIVTVSEPWALGMYDAFGWTIGYEATPEYRETREALAQAILNPALEKARKAGVAAEGHHVLDRYAADGILEAAEQCGSDLIVLASHGRRGINRILLGSQAQLVATHGKVPVLMVR
jgi:nucleotide-binding universal stress UspA family protein